MEAIFLAGPELDARVAKALGWECRIIGKRKKVCLLTDLAKLSPVFSPSTDANSALAALDQIVGEWPAYPFNDLTLDYDVIKRGWWTRLVNSVKSENEWKWLHEVQRFGETLPLSACAAILAFKENGYDREA